MAAGFRSRGGDDRRFRLGKVHVRMRHDEFLPDPRRADVRSITRTVTHIDRREVHPVSNENVGHRFVPRYTTGNVGNVVVIDNALGMIVKVLEVGRMPTGLSVS